MAAASRSIALQSQNELGNAFEEISPSYDLPSNKLPYDIFINHRGPDVKETLATAIYNSLTADGLTVFLDSKELEGGDFLPKEIEEAMRRASLHIAIFSENYAQSPWCLAELSFMVKTATKIVPVFYHVQPTDLRLVAEGVGMYVNAFVEHAQKVRYSFEKLVEWNRALHHVSFYSGYIINCNEEEGNLLKNIVNIAMKMRKVPFEVARYPVGLDEAVEGFQNIFLESTQDHQNVQIMGIYGMGGSGKTTLAKELYNRKCSSFDRCSFIFEVRAAQNALHEKQNKLLWDVGIKDVKIDNVEDGRRILANRLRFVKVLIILDDVDHPNQIDALLPQRNNLASGSLIIVTSRDLSVLTRGRISSVYKTKGLDELNAEQLFCWHAFEKPLPPQEFEVLAKKFTDACDGLPLSIKVLGAQLCGISSTSSWESLLHKISRVLPRDIAGMLKISYDALDEEEQEAFLDIACFFLGEEKGLAIVLWDGLSWSGLHTWETLFNKCLVGLDENNCIRMHDHLRDLGREIANRQPPYRLWSEEQIINVQKQSQERIRIRGITRPRPQWKSGYNRFPPHSSDGKVVINTSEGYCGVTPSSLGLKFFDARGHYFEQEIAELSTELVWLRWYKHGQRNLPSRLSLKNLRILELYEADDLEELWEAYVDPPLELRELIIGSRKFQKFPSSIGHLNNLKKIIVVGAYRSNEALTRLPCHFCSLSSLEHLELKCENLSELPSGFGHLKHLRHLVLRHCKELRNLPVSFKHLTLLQHLELYECGKLTIEMDILENMTKLEYLNFSGCGQLEELPSHITNQAFLKELHLQGTRLKELPSNIGQLGKLKRLKLGGPLFSSGDRLLTSLPTSIGNLSCLRDLLISAFTELEYLPETFMDMTNLETLSITWCPIRELGLGRRSYSHSSLWKLKMINLWNTNVYKISIFEDCCPSIETLDAMFNHHLTEIETLPTSMKFLKVHSCKVLKNIKGIRDLVNLQKLQIFACPELEVLPSFERLTCLKEFNMEDCGKVQKIQGLEHCRSLKTLCIYLKVFGIESLKYQEELSRLELYVDGNILSVEPYTQTMQKWPPEMIICGRKVPGVKSFVNSLPFSGLTTVEPVVEVRTHWLIGMKRRKFWILRCPVMDLDDAAMVCFVINCSKDNVGLSVQTGRFRDCYSMRLGRGKWVWLCVLTQIDFHELEKFEMEEQDCQVEMGILMMGQQRKVADALYQLFR